MQHERNTNRKKARQKYETMIGCKKRPQTQKRECGNLTGVALSGPEINYSRERRKRVQSTHTKLRHPCLKGQT